MTGFERPELGEPTEADKEDFRKAIQAVLRPGEAFRSTKLADQRALTVSRTDEDDDEASYDVTFLEIIPGIDSSATKSTYYHVYDNGEVAQTSILEEERTPAEQAEADQFKAAIDEIRAKGGTQEDVNAFIDARIAAEILLPSGSEEAMALLYDAISTTSQEDALGLPHVSAGELRDVIFTVQRADWDLAEASS